MLIFRKLGFWREPEIAHAKLDMEAADEAATKLADAARQLDHVQNTLNDVLVMMKRHKR